LGQVIELRDAYTGGHTMRVTHYATLIAERMGLPSDQLELVRLGAPLHDIGKIGIADSILRKEGNLTDSEREQMRGHTVLGDQILKSHPGLMKVAAIARSHHERHDGLGYPDGLKGDAIPLLARVVSVADTFDAMTSDRPYRARMKLQDALAFMAAESEKQFHPEVLKVFLEFASSLSIAP
jgi:putative nucleotidyltransferase with HDIG domain